MRISCEQSSSFCLKSFRNLFSLWTLFEAFGYEACWGDLLLVYGSITFDNFVSFSAFLMVSLLRFALLFDRITRFISWRSQEAFSSYPFEISWWVRFLWLLKILSLIMGYCLRWNIFLWFDIGDIGAIPYSFMLGLW